MDLSLIIPLYNEEDQPDVKQHENRVARRGPVANFQSNQLSCIAKYSA